MRGGAGYIFSTPKFFNFAAYDKAKANVEEIVRFALPQINLHNECVITKHPSSH